MGYDYSSTYWATSYFVDNYGTISMTDIEITKETITTTRPEKQMTYDDLLNES